MERVDQCGLPYAKAGQAQMGRRAGEDYVRNDRRLWSLLALTFFIAIGTNTTLADLLTPLLVANPFSAVRAFLRWWASDCFEDGVTYRWQGGLRRRSVDSFFPAVLF